MLLEVLTVHVCKQLNVWLLHSQPLADAAAMVASLVSLRKGVSP